MLTIHLVLLKELFLRSLILNRAQDILGTILHGYNQVMGLWCS